MRANFESRRIREGQRHSSSAAPSEWCSMKTPRQSIKLEEEQRQLLEEWVRAHRTPQQVVKRCQIILRSAEGKSEEAIAKELDINGHTCRLWRERFASCRADCSANGKQTCSPLTGAVTILRLSLRLLLISCTRALVGVGS